MNHNTEPKTMDAILKDCRNVQKWLAEPRTTEAIKRYHRFLSGLSLARGSTSMAANNNEDDNAIRGGMRALVDELNQREHLQAVKEIRELNVAQKAPRKKRRVGSRGGRPTEDGEEAIAKAVKDVLALIKYNPSIGMKRACEIACDKNKLLIKWAGLRKHVPKAKKRARIKM